jgi:hypothetical protein
LATIDAPILMTIPRVFVYIGLAGWTLAMTGPARKLLRART